MAIYARLENGTYAEVTGVYKTDGTEVAEIFQGDRLVYSASSEIYGSLPLYYDGKGYDLTDYLISGNTVQDGTPSSDAPVEVQGCGVRTGNLADLYNVNRTGLNLTFTTGNNMTVVINGTKARGPNVIPIAEPNVILPAGTYTVTIKMISGSITNTSEGAYFGINGNTYSQRTTPTVKEIGDVGKRTFTLSEDTLLSSLDIAPSYSDAESVWNDATFECMLYSGSNDIPYEPYGYKLPLTVNGTEYPIYLGQVETTRRVKKLVLTGEEYWQLWNGNYYSSVIDRKGAISTILCTHFVNASGGITYSNQSSSGLKIANVAVPFVTSVADLKAWLAAQYAAGTPVTIWYVLAELETAVVNEPLMKIGDYADTISFAQAGVAIPTVNGSNVLDMASTVKPSEVYVKGKGIKPTGYGQLTDVNSVNILDKDGRPINVHGQ